MLKTKIKFENFRKAFISLKAVYLKPKTEDRAYIDATIQRFEFTFELAWKLLKEYFAEKGIILNYPKEILKEAFATNVINDEDIWIHMLVDRNMTSHTYDEKLADEIYKRIKIYVPAIEELLKFFEKI